MNILLTLIGWLGWNAFEFNMAKNEKDDKDEEFSFSAYAKKKYDDWFASLLVAVFLLLAGHMGLGLDLLRVIDFDHPDLKWSDLYYAGSGVIYEAAKFAYKKWKGTKQ